MISPLPLWERARVRGILVIEGLSGGEKQWSQRELKGVCFLREDVRGGWGEPG